MKHGLMLCLRRAVASLCAAIRTKDDLPKINLCVSGRREMKIALRGDD